MKHLILAFFLLPLFVQGQVVGDKDLSKLPEVKYIRLKIGATLNVKKKAFDYSVVADAGFDPGGWVYKDGQPFVPTSEMEAVNFFAGFGWEVVSESYLPSQLAAIGTFWTVVMRRK